MFAYKKQNNYNFDNYDSRKIASKYVEDALNLGVKLMADKNLTIEQVDVWLDYTEEILEIGVKNVVYNVLAEFLALKVKIHFKNEVEPFRKLHAYLMFLIEVNKLLNK